MPISFDTDGWNYEHASLSQVAHVVQAPPQEDPLLRPNSLLGHAKKTTNLVVDKRGDPGNSNTLNTDIAGVTPPPSQPTW